MSTKIYQGYRLPNVKTLKDLEILRTDLITKAKTVKVQTATQLAIRSSVHMLDLYKVGFNVPDPKQTIFGYGYHKVQERFRKFKKEPYRDPYYDLRFELIVFLTDPPLAIFIGENKNMISILANHPYIEWYGYWNNSDPPEDITDEEWEQREKDWEFLNGPICNQGLIIAMDDMLFFQTEEEAFNSSWIQNWEHRCRETAKNIILYKIDQEEVFVPGLSDNKEEKQNPVDNANIIYRWLEKGEGSELIDKEIKEIESILVKNLMYQDIFKTSFEVYPQTNRLS
jgi:hypothetical protein